MTILIVLTQVGRAILLANSDRQIQLTTIGINCSWLNLVQLIPLGLITNSLSDLSNEIQCR